MIINRIQIAVISGEKQKTREGFLGSSILLQSKTSKSEWWYMHGELFILGILLYA